MASFHHRDAHLVCAQISDLFLTGNFFLTCGNIRCHASTVSHTTQRYNIGKRSSR